MATVTIQEQEQTPANDLENIAAQSAVIAADTAIALANAQAGLAELEAAQIISEAKEDIEENERDISWLKQQLQEVQNNQSSLANSQAELMEMMGQLLAKLSAPQVLPVETETPEVMTDLSGTNLEPSSVMPMVAPGSVAEESPAQAVEELAEAIKARVKRAKLI